MSKFHFLPITSSFIFVFLLLHTIAAETTTSTASASENHATSGGRLLRRNNKKMRRNLDKAGADNMNKKRVMEVEEEELGEAMSADDMDKSPYEQCLFVGGDGMSYPSFAWTQSGPSVILPRQRRVFVRSETAISEDGKIVAYATFPAFKKFGSLRVRSLTDDGKEWKKLGQTIFGTRYRNGGSDFASSFELSADGSSLVVGGDDVTSDDTTTTNVRFDKYVKVLSYNGTVWKPVGKRIIRGWTDKSSNRGTSVSMSADGSTIAAAGGSLKTKRLNAKVFKYSGNAWEQVGQDINGGSMAPEKVSLSADGHSLAVASFENDKEEPTSKVQVSVYSLSEENKWVKLGQTIDIEAGKKTSEVVYIDLSGDGSILAVGVVGSGYTRVYSFNGNEWTQMGQQLDASTVGGNFGIHVSLSDDGCTLSGIKYDESPDFLSDPEGTVNVFSFDGSHWVQQGGGDLFPAKGATISGDGYAIVGTGRSFGGSGNITVFETVL